ncbi:MAG: hypothetical protein H0X27_00630 [Caulobacteraceae bacterium]|nr:hypothetical protein [Caulobacteraceae bacterium]
MATLGSCRVHIPLGRLAGLGELTHYTQGMALTHTAAEAMQTLDLVMGARRIPEALALFVFGAEPLPPPDLLREGLRRGIDAVLLEVSQARQFLYGDICLQTNLFSRHFIRAHGGALLPWFRLLCGGRTIDEAVIQSALENLRAGGHRPDEQVVDLLRGVRMEIPGRVEIARTLEAMMVKLGGRWTVIGALEAPGHEGAIMRQRRALNATLEQAAGQCGAAFYNPTRLIIDHGRATVLDGGGADIHE